MREQTQQSTAAHNVSSDIKDSVSIEEIAKSKANPEMWLFNYGICRSELNFTPDRAMRWADIAVKADSETKVWLRARGK
jgi:hypothetical protein